MLSHAPNQRWLRIGFLAFVLGGIATLLGIAAFSYFGQTETATTTTGPTPEPATAATSAPAPSTIVPEPLGEVRALSSCGKLCPS